MRRIIERIEKYNATGNTFIVVDCAYNVVSDEEKREIVLKNCENRDGALFVEKRQGMFHMDYFNRDGKRASFCGNGFRTFAAYLRDFYGILGEVQISTNAGVLKAIIDSTINAQMPHTKYVREVFFENFHGVLMETGVPHLVFNVDDVERVEMDKIAPKLRWQYDANVDFFEVLGERSLKVRTYERGVEAETLSCGSGITTVAYFYKYYTLKDPILPDKINITARGGNLSVFFTPNEIYLEGDVVHE
jgi:diaminopimelate epimerase